MGSFAYPESSTEVFSLIFLAVFFFPIAVYCLILGALNRRAHPVLVRGPWDCLGLLLASSGLILFGGPALLSAFYRAEVRDFLLGKLRDVRMDFGDLFNHWWHIWLLYYLVVFAGCACLLWWRRSLTAVYNVEPAVLDDLLAQALDRMGVEWTRMGNRVFIGFRATGNRSLASRYQIVSAPASEHVAAAGFPRKNDSPPATPARQGQAAVLDVEPFFATRHVTLDWKSATSLLRAEVEAELARDLAATPAPDNPAGVWFMIVASVLFFVIFLSVAVLFFLEILARGGARGG
jgi:hypothetical protein